MKSAITAASPAARSFGSSASAASTTTLPATKLAGSSPSMYSGWPGDVCSTSLIQIAGCSSGCITAKKSQNVSGAVKSSPLTPESLIACHCAANSLNAGACSAYAAAPAPRGRRTPSTASSTSPPLSSGSGVAVSATHAGSVARCTAGRNACIVGSGAGAYAAARSSNWTADIAISLRAREAAVSGSKLKLTFASSPPVRNLN